MLGEIIAFIAGTMAGVTLMCIVSVNQKDQRQNDRDCSGRMEDLPEPDGADDDNSSLGMGL